MMHRLSPQIGLALFLGLFLSFGGWAVEAAPASPGTVEQEQTAKPSAGELVTVEDPALQEIKAFEGEIRTLLKERRFAELETKARELRASKALFGNGEWKIATFYMAPDLTDRDPEESWMRQQETYRQWVKAEPKSITAHVAYGRSLSVYAWHARGTGSSYTVTSDGWSLLAKRLAQSREILELARDLPEKDPMWWTAMLRVALGQEWTKEQYDKLLLEATTFEPHFQPYYTARAQSLLPNWFGKEGEWEKYAEQVTTKIGADGPELYARIVFTQRRYYGNIFQETKASWPKTKEGLETLLQKYPSSIQYLTYATQLGQLGGDRPFAKKYSDRLGLRYLPSAWWDQPKLFHEGKKWADGVR